MVREMNKVEWKSLVFLITQKINKLRTEVYTPAFDCKHNKASIGTRFYNFIYIHTDIHTAAFISFIYFFLFIGVGYDFTNLMEYKKIIKFFNITIQVLNSLTKAIIVGSRSFVMR